ncbi:Uma2 family endonuclease [Emticicia sp. SJ17W-69]|uniref:Uma2 family endonuclease n=1 Tax=Emticicia sp. SJ17W-69 TaxID=3421657 RepID=UPI003EB8A5FC
MLTETLVSDKKYSLEEYFEFEKTSEIRHEFVNGELIPMPGESKKANEIAGNIYVSLRNSFKKRALKVYNHDVRLMLDNGSRYRYPDIAVAPTIDDEDSHAITQPVLIVEVFSENSVKIDTVDKLKEYSVLPTLQYYLIVSQEEPFVEVYAKNADKWEFRYYADLQESIELNTLNVSLLMGDIFEGIF